MATIRCRDCDKDTDYNHVENARVNARIHSVKTGHIVYVLTDDGAE